MEASHGLDLVFWNLLSFSLLIFIMRYAFWPKLYQTIQARRDQLQNLLKTYNAQNAEVAKLVEKMQQESVKAGNRRRAIIEETKKESAMIREDIISKAHNEATSLVSRARIEIAQEKDVAYNEVRQEISTIVIRAVQHILENVIDAKLDKKIMEETRKITKILE